MTARRRILSLRRPAGSRHRDPRSGRVTTSSGSRKAIAAAGDDASHCRRDHGKKDNGFLHQISSPVPVESRLTISAVNSRTPCWALMAGMIVAANRQGLLSFTEAGQVALEVQAKDRAETAHGRRIEWPRGVAREISGRGAP
jgi:hypothetical protein